MPFAIQALGFVRAAPSIEDFYDRCANDSQI